MNVVKNATLDFLSKYESDLDYLKHGRDKVYEMLTDEDLENEQTVKRLTKLDNSISYLEKAIANYKNEKID